jgi:ATP synthase protein I
MSSEKEKLENLAERIRRAEEGAKPKPMAGSDPVRNAGYDFAGVVIGSVVLGIFLDRFLGTGPWFLVGMVVMGFAAGLVGVWRSMQKSSGKE